MMLGRFGSFKWSSVKVTHAKDLFKIPAIKKPLENTPFQSILLHKLFELILKKRGSGCGSNLIQKL